MKLKSLYIAIGLLSAPLTTSAQEAPDSFNTNQNLATALSHVDTDGDALSVSNDKDLLEDMAKYYDDLLGPFFEMNEQTKLFKFGKIIKTLGLDGITATASSAKKYDGHCINKMFIQTTQNNKGLWSFWGKQNQKLTADTFAPADTSLLSESQLNTAQLYDMVIEIIKTVNRDEVEKSMNLFKQPIPHSDMTVKDLLAKIDTRISIVAKIDLKASITNPSTPPKYAVTAKLERLANLLWPILQPELTKFGKIETNGNQQSIALPEMHTEMGPLILTLVFDLNTDNIWLTTDTKHLAACNDVKGEKLATSDHYKAATAKLPSTACEQLYLSRDIIVDLTKMSAKSLDFAGKQEPVPTIQKFITSIIPYAEKSQGIAYRAQKNKDGILFAINTPFRIRGSAVQYLTLTSVIASVSTPLVIQKKKEADTTKNIMHMKQLHLALFEYEHKFGAYPKQLEDLIKLEGIDLDRVNTLRNMHTDKGDLPATYIYRENIKDGNIILHTPASIGDKHVILGADGAVLTIPAERLQQMLNK